MSASPDIRGGVSGLLLAVLCIVLFHSVAAADSPAEAPVRAVPRLTWRAPNRVDWRLGIGPFWSSMGHTVHVMCLLPIGVKEADGRVVETRDGSGFIDRVRIEVHRVDAFAPGSSVPRRTTLLAAKVIDAADDSGLRRRKGWPFPREQAMDFEFAEVPAMEHQTLTRIFVHGDAQFWYTLMIHAEGDVENLPAELQSSDPLRTRYFKELISHTIVCELLHDPSLKLTSTYIEPDDPPSTNWIDNERVKAPWAYGEGPLVPAVGSLQVNADGTLVFGRLSEAATRAGAELRAREAGGKVELPKLPSAGGLGFGEPEERVPAFDDLKAN